MAERKLEDFKKELYELLQKYNVDIEFAIDWSISDPNVYAIGLIAEDENGNTMELTEGWHKLSAKNIKKEEKNKKINPSPIM